MLKGVEDFHGGVGLGAGMIGVGDGFASDFLEEDREHAVVLQVDENVDIYMLQAAALSEPLDRRVMPWVLSRGTF